MKQFTEDEIVQAYAYYGVQLSGVEPVQTGPLEDVILSVIENPPPGRIISTTPALIAKNAGKIDFSYLVREANKSTELSAKLGFILDVTKSSVQEVKKPDNYEQIIGKLEKVIDTLKKSEKKVVWISQQALKFYNETDMNLEFPLEKKWNVRSKNAPEDFNQHLEEYTKKPKTYDENEIAQAYAFYGVQVTNAKPVKTGYLDDIIASVLESVLPEKFIIALPALIVKHGKQIDFEFLAQRASKHEYASARLGLILDITRSIIEEIGKTDKNEELIKRIDQTLPLLTSLKEYSGWSSSGDKPKTAYEAKWQVTIRAEAEDFKRATVKYVQ